MRGYHLAYMKKFYARKGFDLDITEADEQDLLEGKFDYLGFLLHVLLRQAHRAESALPLRRRESSRPQ